MSVNRRKYNEEFKKYAVSLCDTGSKTVKETAEYLGISESSLYKWRRLYAAPAEETQTAEHPEPQPAEVLDGIPPDGETQIAELAEPQPARMYGVSPDEETQIAERAETEAKPPENYTPPPKTKRGIGAAMKGAAIAVIIAAAVFAGVILSRDSQSPTDENERQIIVAEAEDSDVEIPAEKADFISLDEIIAAAKELALRTPSPDENDAAAAEENAESPSLDEITATNESALRIPPTDGDIVSAALTAAEITALPSVNETVEIPSPSGNDAARSQYVSIFDALKPEPMNDYDFVDLIAKGTLPQVTEAIDNGANVNASVRGWTTLVYAASSNRNPEVITALAEAGADVNARDGNGVTPLMSAVSYNSNPEIITALVNAGADVNARNNQGSTPLMFAAGRNSNPEVIKTLLALGADPRLKERFSSGNMAIDYARENENLKNTDVISLLNGFE